MRLLIRRQRRGNARLHTRIVIAHATAQEQLLHRTNRNVSFNAFAPRLANVQSLPARRNRAARIRARRARHGLWRIEVVVIGDVVRTLRLQPTRRLKIETNLSAQCRLGLEVGIRRRDLRRANLLPLQFGEIRRAERLVHRTTQRERRYNLVHGTETR